MYSDFDYDSARKWYLSQAYASRHALRWGSRGLSWWTSRAFVWVMLIGALGYLLGVRPS